MPLNNQLLDNLGEAYALHKVIYDKNNKPIDYKFIEVNHSFEKMTGLSRNNIIGENVTDVIPGIEKDPASWIDKYGEIASKEGSSAVFNDIYSDALKKWFSVNVYSPKKGFFVTLFSDVTERHLREDKLKEHIENLDRLNKILIGRELRMAELKEELGKVKKSSD